MGLFALVNVGVAGFVCRRELASVLYRGVAKPRLLGDGEGVLID